MRVSRNIRTGLIEESIPEELGSDLLCNLSYAHHSYPGKTVMTVDFGTALTFSTVGADGKVLGVSIAPGLVTAVNSLFSNTAQLPQVELKIPQSVLGRKQELGESINVIATGGLSKVISPLIDRFEKVDGYHTLKGLVLLSELNDH